MNTFWKEGNPRAYFLLITPHFRQPSGRGVSVLPRGSKTAFFSWFTRFAGRAVAPVPTPGRGWPWVTSGPRDRFLPPMRGGARLHPAGGHGRIRFPRVPEHAQRDWKNSSKKKLSLPYIAGAFAFPDSKTLKPPALIFIENRGRGSQEIK